MKDVFHISRLIIKEKLKVLTDLEKTDLERLNHKLPFSDNVKIEDLVDKVSSYSTINKDRAWEAIEAKFGKVQNKPKRVVKLFNRPWHKYAAAAVFVGLLATAYFFKDNLLNSRTNHVETPSIVDTNLIEPGTDKATLTLANGEQVPLEKGTAFQTSNANSNGEQIVYAAGNRKTKELTYNYLTIPRGGQFHIVLSDGTEVWLNSESQLKYPVSFIDGETRQVELVYGEAYFDVTPSSENNGSKFIVLNKSQEVEVLGTEFNIKAYRDETNIYTTLVEGKVIVANQQGVTRNLTPNYQSVLSMETAEFKITTVDVNSETSWRRGVFSFKGKPLKDVMKVISRWYDVDVVFANKELESIKFKGNLNKDRSIERILSLMLSDKLKSYEIKDKTIILK
ncbi:FecR family protein [Seonamhaeicola sp.]|uniref:FecR family protein n=1 Tax=Seonamhaeicola sp. TaxID=1912245 RepID=UPI00262BC155|nr:FecR family protein [Seonamhaeicola sp.]